MSYPGAVKAVQPYVLCGGTGEAIEERVGGVEASRLGASSHEPFYIEMVIQIDNRKSRLLSSQVG
jgi:hypothetical protein